MAYAFGDPPAEHEHAPPPSLAAPTAHARPTPACSQITAGLLEVIAENGKLKDMDKIHELFGSLMDAKNGLVQAVVTSASVSARTASTTAVRSSPPVLWVRRNAAAVAECGFAHGASPGPDTPGTQLSS